jgi:hypothetical protein
MPFYEVNCNLCQNRTLHSADDGGMAEEKHRGETGHVETQKRWDELTSSVDNKIKNMEFNHGKEHNG